MHLPFDDIRRCKIFTLVTSVTFFVADMKFGLHEINKNDGTHDTRGPSQVQKMFETEPKRRRAGEIHMSIVTLNCSLTQIVSFWSYRGRVSNS